MTTATVEDKKGVEIAPPGKRQVIPVGFLQESPTNPRKNFDEATLQELADSIKVHGLLQPLVVRPHDKVFEIVAGARRYRACRMAGLKEIPCEVHEYSDTQALEAQIIENLQREDVSAIDEAFGYRELLKRGYSIEQLAKAIKKGVRYVYARLELQKLAPKVREAVEKGEISPSHAQVIGRLGKEEDQVDALERCFIKEWNNGDPLLVQKREDYRQVEGLISTRELEKIVASMALGAEITAQHEALEIAGHKAFIISEQDYNRHRAITSRNKWKSQGAKPCKFPAKGVFVDGPKRGKVIDVCTTTNCTQHFKTHNIIAGRSTSKAKPSVADRLKDFRAQAQREQQKTTANLILTEYVRTGHSLLDREDLERIAFELCRGCDFYRDEDVMVQLFPFMKGSDWSRQKKEISKLKDKDLVHLIRGASWSMDANEGGYSSNGSYQDFLARAKDLKVNVDQINKSAAAELRIRCDQKRSELVKAEKAAKANAKKK
ncbi:MAG TPA: ParB/RepB/Spo0J family partition protein [Planctomycetota bacterium]|nr:ParB/RepB/Spo0J family partition protein [Planctomycetota bacterium]